MDTQNLILKAIMMTSRYNFDDDCLSNLIESEAALIAGLSADDSERDILFT